MNYEEVKELAKERGVSVKDLIVLSPKNDPFYVGSPAEVEKGKWFSAVYAKMGRPQECHIRRVHYWLVSQHNYQKPDGKRYENTENDWNFLTLAAKYARYLGLVPFDRIVDRRNPDPEINATFWEHDMPSDEKERIDADEIVDSIARKFTCANPSMTQPVMVELWCEKSTMNDVLVPLARKYGANLVTGLGELSITAVHELAKRAASSGKPVRIFYISDFDPAGECMPVSVSRKIEFFMQEVSCDVKLRQIMLTAAQCKSFKLPRTPIKDTESRKGGFEERHGTGATELDALEALHPGEMRKLIESAILEYFDVDAWNAAIELNEKVRDRVREHLAGKIGDVLEELDMEDLDHEVEELPEPGDGDTEETDGEQTWIFDSELDYDEQLDAYRDFQRRTS